MIHVSWEERALEVRVSSSLDGGFTFNKPTVVWPLDTYFSSQQISMVSPNTDIHISWTLFPIIGGAEIFYARSTDGGTTFSDPIAVSNWDSFNSFDSSTASDGSG